ncbi:hypothetical protein [Nocardioides sp.]|uniref:hypothetical protein n=1 Tax=Nocardioides sp. TaxID=35761 RepID=UPI002603EC40|nr:hypothetical protein [Nocardioides sp.]
MRRTSTALRGASVVILVVLAAGCGSQSSDQAKASDVSSESPSESSSESPAPSVPVEVAVADLAARLGIDAASVEVVAEEPVTWSDGSLGCAEKGFAYTQALVEGSRITLQADGASYEYHTGGASQRPFWCESPTE